MIKDEHKISYLLIKGEKVPIWTYGNPKNLPIIFIHGYPIPFSDYIGDLPIRYMMDKYYFLAFDLPGFGKSVNVKIDSILFLRILTKKLLEGVKFILFATSIGGILALQYVRKYPKDVKAIIISGLPYIGFLANHFIFIKPYLRFFGFRIQNTLKNYSVLSNKSLTEIKSPTLLLYSYKDSIATVKMARNLQKLIPKSKLAKINSRSHVWLLHKINENSFLSEINKFLKGL